jgi:DNA primase
MFPLCDARGRVLGFGARAVGERQQPRYLNSSDNEIYHKGRHLFGADIARAYAARAGSVIVAERCTDVIAMHQAGLRNTVGLVGTTLTEEQVGELARLAPTVALALGADSAGQEAMLRAARVAAARNLAVRVVPLPQGEHGADLVQSEGAKAVQQRVDASVPFVRFRVERELEAGDLSTAKGKYRVSELDQALGELRELARGIHPSVLTDRGLDAALDGLACRAPLPVELEETPAERLPDRVESAAYFVVAEALTNVAKYAQATHARVNVSRHSRQLLVEVSDDGVGGADPATGSGLRGLLDRVSAVGGRFEVDSRRGQGTTVRATIPCE